MNFNSPILLALNISSHDDVIGFIPRSPDFRRWKGFLQHAVSHEVPGFSAVLVEEVESDVLFAAAGAVQRVEENADGYLIYLEPEAGLGSLHAEHQRLLSVFQYSISPRLARVSYLIANQRGPGTHPLSRAEFSGLRSGTVFFASTILHFFKRSLPHDLWMFPSRQAMAQYAPEKRWNKALTILLDFLDEELVAPTSMAFESLQRWSALRQAGAIPQDEKDAILFAQAGEEGKWTSLRLVPDEVRPLARALELGFTDGRPVSRFIDNIREELSRFAEDATQHGLARRFDYPGPWGL